MIWVSGSEFGISVLEVLSGLSCCGLNIWADVIRAYGSETRFRGLGNGLGFRAGPKIEDLGSKF